MKIFLAGEGSDELGGWAGNPAYRPRDHAPETGILEALLNRFCPNADIVDGIEWKRIRKYRAGDHAAPETRTVLGLVLRADEDGCDGVVFVRDRDRDEDRELDIEAGIKLAEERFSDIRLAGGTANEEIEAWLLALLGEKESERHADAKAVLEKEHGTTTRDAKIAIVDSSDVSRVVGEAVCLSFHRWATRASTLAL